MTFAKVRISTARSGPARFTTDRIEPASDSAVPDDEAASVIAVGVYSEEAEK